MPWLLFLIAIALFLIALGATSMTMVILCVLGSLALSGIAVMSLLAQRVDNSARSETMLIDPMELRRMREQAEAKRAETAAASSTSLQTSAVQTAPVPPGSAHMHPAPANGDRAQS